MIANASLEFRRRILERRNKFVYFYKHTSAQVQRSRKLLCPKDDLNVFAYTQQNSHCNLSETSLKFTSGLDNRPVEFLIVISIRDSNLHTHVLKKIVIRVIFHVESSFK